jgi:hypothetical protein
MFKTQELVWGLIDRKGSEVTAIDAAGVRRLGAGRWAIIRANAPGIYDLKQHTLKPVPGLTAVQYVTSKAALLEISGAHLYYLPLGGEPSRLNVYSEKMKLLGANLALLDDGRLMLRRDKTDLPNVAASSAGEEYMGVMPVRQTTGVGLLGPEGNWVLQPKYGEIKDFNHGWAAAKLGNRWSMIDLRGNPMFDVPGEVKYFTGRFVYTEEQGKGQLATAVFNRSGKKIHSFTFKVTGQ